MDQIKIDRCIETVCQSGCRETRRVISALEQNEPLSGMNAAECGEVLRELKAIMAVYDRPCDV